MIVKLLLFTVAVVLLPIAFIVEAKSSDDVIEVAANEIYSPSGDRVIAITVRNKGYSEVKAIELGILSATASQERLPSFDLPPARSLVRWRLLMGRGFDNDEKLLVLVSYNIGSLRDEFVAPVNSAAPVAATNSTGLQIVTIAGSLLSAVVGGVMVHKFTALRDRNNEKSKRLKAKFDKEEPLYRVFINEWAELTVIDELRSAFRNLSNATLVPRTIVSEYEQTLRILQNANSPEVARRSAAAKLADAVSVYVSKLELDSDL